MGTNNVHAGPVRVSPDQVARMLAAEITRCEIDASDAMSTGDEQAALGMLARAGGLADAHALITGACRTCGQHVGQPHHSVLCRSGSLAVGGRGPSDPVYCADVAPARTWSSFEAMQRDTRQAA